MALVMLQQRVSMRTTHRFGTELIKNQLRKLIGGELHVK